MADSFPKPGEWPCDRASGGQDSRSKARGAIAAPEIAWKEFVGMVETPFVLEPSDGDTRVAVPMEAPPAGSDELHDPRWGLVPEQGLIEGRLQPIHRSAVATYADILPDVPGLEKVEFESGFSLPTVNGQWQPARGRCLTWKAGAWEKVWETEPIDLMFQPRPIVGDFDSDGQLEVAACAWTRLMIFDAKSGKIKDQCVFTDGRTYGLFGAFDFNRDGKAEFLYQADFSKHVDVLGYRNGKLILIWRRAIELDTTNPQKPMRVAPIPVGDVDGDGVQEVMVNIFNDGGDQRWHLTIHDGMTGEVKADLVDEYIHGVADINGDGLAELFTVRTNGGGVPEYGKIAIMNCKGGTPQVLWRADRAAWSTWTPPAPAHIQNSSTWAQKQVLWRTGADHARLVLRRPVGSAAWETRLVVAGWIGAGLKSECEAVGPCLKALAIDGQGRLLAQATTRPGEAADIKVSSGSLRLLRSQQCGLPSPAVVVWDRQDPGPTIIVRAGSRDSMNDSDPAELVLFRAPRGNRPGREVLRLPGWGQTPGGPVTGDLFGDGRRQLIYATAAPSGYGRLVAADLTGRQLWHHDFPNIPGQPPIWNVGGIILWQAGRFATKTGQDVLVTIRRSMMHSEETLLLSGKDGHEIWHRDRQISGRAVGGTPFAIADFDGDGLEDIASLHPSILYIMKGSTGDDIIAMDTTWDRIPAKPVYWGVAIAGDFEGNGRISIFFGTTRRSMTGLVRADGSLVWFDALDRSPTCLPAFGDFDGDARLEAIGIGYDDGIRCYDTATGRIKWRMIAPAEGQPYGTASGDVNSDGRDEALFMIGNTLYCLGTEDKGTSGSLLWQLDIPTSVSAPVIADIDGSGEVSILLVGSDGYVYCLR